MDRDQIAMLEKRWSSCKYKPEYDQLLLDHLSKGLSISSFDTPEGVSYVTVLAWCKRFPSFAQAREIGDKARLAMLEEEGIKMVRGGNVVAWKFLMNQHGQHETIEVQSSPIMNVNASVRYIRLQKLKELHQRVTLEQEKAKSVEAPAEIIDLKRTEALEDDELFRD